MPRKIEMIGKSFNRLTVIKEAYVDERGEYIWECICDCGKISFVPGWNIRSGHTKSCGCYNEERLPLSCIKHGKTNTRIFKIWYGIIRRCREVGSRGYKNYGAKGIKVCERWMKFENFYEDTKEGYADNLSLDRYPNRNGDYEPSNFRWASAKQQNNNKNNNIFIQIDSEIKTLSEWSEISGIKSATIRARIQNGWDSKDAVFTPKYKQLCQKKA